MLDNIKAIIFDWGKTLHDPTIDALFPGAAEVVRILHEKYTLALISLAVSETSDVRRKKIDESGIAQYFKIILVDTDNKDAMYERVIQDLGVSPPEVAVVDDRVVRGVAWGNHHGAATIWIQQGEFADELPDEHTGKPTYIIKDISELKNIL